jgi:hypothetical protein
MPSSERGGGNLEPPDQQPSAEHEPVPYLRAARFASDRLAGQVYFQVQEAIYSAEANDLSAYRFQLNRISHVAVLGNPPPPDLDNQLSALLAAGEPATLPPEVVTALQERRAQAIRHGPWTERHYRPGKPL